MVSWQINEGFFSNAWGRHKKKNVFFSGRATNRWVQHPELLSKSSQEKMVEIKDDH